MKKDKEGGIVPEAGDTVRHRLVAELRKGPLSAKELSGLIGIPEKDVYGHLEHVRTSLRRSGKRLLVRPAECAHCGFLFQKRDRLGKPGKCPVCRKGPVHPPLFSLAEE